MNDLKCCGTCKWWDGDEGYIGAYCTREKSNGLRVCLFRYWSAGEKCKYYEQGVGYLSDKEASDGKR